MSTPLKKVFSIIAVSFLFLHIFSNFVFAVNPTEEEFIQNGDFSWGTSNWSFSDFEVSDGALIYDFDPYFNTTSTATQTLNISDFLVTQDYVFSFNIRKTYDTANSKDLDMDVYVGSKKVDTIAFSSVPLSWELKTYTLKWSDFWTATPQIKFEIKWAYQIAASAFKDISMDNISFMRVNVAPTDISLSNISIDENVSTNTLIWNLSSIDPDVWDTHTYSLTCGTSGVDDGNFAINSNHL